MLRELVPQPLRRRLRRVLMSVELRVFGAKARWRLRNPRKGRRHGLDSELIVSLTSYPGRFATLHLSLGCLLDQTVAPDRIILWIAHQDIGRLPPGVASLKRRGLDIRTCDDLGAFKKLVCAVEQLPSAYIVTADDDLYYRRDWLERLVDEADGQTIVCHRAHRPRRNEHGRLKPYLRWELDVQDKAARVPNAEIMPTSGAGVLYPPKSLHPMLTNREQFLSLCPTGDDLWFYWCARMAGTLHKKIGGRMRLITWPGSQESSLWDTNMAGGNDRMIAALEAEFGRP